MYCPFKLLEKSHINKAENYIGHKLNLVMMKKLLVDFGPGADNSTVITPRYYPEDPQPYAFTFYTLTIIVGNDWAKGCVSKVYCTVLNVQKRPVAALSVSHRARRLQTSRTLHTPLHAHISNDDLQTNYFIPAQ